MKNKTSIFNSVKTFISNYRFCLGVLYKANRKVFVTIVILTIMTSLLPIAHLYLGKLLLNELYTGIVMNNGIDYEFIMILLLSFFLLNCGVVFLDSLIGKVYRIEASSLGIYLNTNLMRQSAAIDIQYFDIPKEFDNIMRSKNNAFSIQSTIFDTIDILRNLISLIGTFIIACSINAILAGLAIVIVIPYFLVSGKLQKISYQFYIDNQLQNRKKGYLYNLFFQRNSIKELTFYNATDYIHGKFLKEGNNLIIKERQFNRKKNFLSFLGLLPKILFGILVKVVIVVKIIVKELSIGDFTYVTSLLGNLTNYSEGLVYNIAAYIGYNEKIQDYKKYFALLTPSVASGNTYIKSIETIRFENVTFTYPNTTEPVLKNISFAINKGEKVMLVGENGCGKTTLIKILCRFYDVDSGDIFINNINIKEIDIDNIRSLMSTVFQDFNIYYLTIRENVALSNLNNKDNDKVIKSALDMATFSNKIYDEQLDLDLIIGRNFNGLELSGGERQKLAMARAFARNSKLVILDEPTASLDPESEYFILQNFKKLYDNKTLIMISHRLTNSKDMSKIIVMDNGRIIENGNHNELIANRMKYCKFYTLQAMKYNTEGL